MNKQLFLTLLTGAFLSSATAQTDTLYYKLNVFGNLIRETDRKPELQTDPQFFKRVSVRRKGIPDVYEPDYKIEYNSMRLLSNGQLIWERSYPMDLSMDDLLVKLFETGYFQENQTINETVFLKLKGLGIAYDQMGRSRFSVPNDLTGALLEGAVTLQQEGDRVKVRLSNILVNQPSTGSGESFRGSQQIPLENLGVRQGVVEKWFRDYHRKFLNFTFENLFGTILGQDSPDNR